MLALTLVVELILYVAVGIFLQKRRLVGEDFDRQLSVIYTDIFLPCLIFDSFQLSFDPSDLRNCAILIGLVLLACCAILILSDLIVSRHRRQ